jgi:spermidine synthase
MGDRVLHLLFFLSGASSLIYQIVWVREFGNVFGNTTHSAALVIAVFMAGLGLGSYLGGRWADRRYAERARSLIVAYGGVELAIGGLGLVVSLLLPRLGDLAAVISSYTRDAQGWYVLSTSSYLARYVIAAALLLPITLLMGSTLTLLVRHRVRQDIGTAGWRIGLLYGVNTAGAALGALLTDHAFIPHLGLQGTQMIAVLFNVLSGLGALRLAQAPATASEPTTASEGPPAAAEPAVASRVPVGWLVGVAVFVSGFVAMALEIVWFRHLSAVFGGFRAVLSTILTVILVGIWLGSLLGASLHRRLGRPYLLFMGAQALLVTFTLFGVASVALSEVTAERLRTFHAFAQAAAWQAEAVQLWIVLKYIGLELGVPALMMGFTYPIANAMIQDAEGAVGRRAGALYLANTGGAVLGALTAGFALLPALGMQRSITALAVVALLALSPVYVAAARRAEPGPARRLNVGALAGSLAIAGCAVLLWMRLPGLHVVEGTIPRERPGDRVVTVVEGVQGTFVVMDYDTRRALVTNGHPMSSTSWLGQRYMRAFSHIPLLSMERPARALVIAFGVGNTVHAAALHPSVERIDVVDTSPEVLRLAPYFAAANRDVLADPKVAVHVNDGRHHLRLQPPSHYDLITLEPPPISHAGVAALYSQEFYDLARSRLRPGGYLTQWLPVYQVPAEVAMSMIHAFLEAFPGAVLLSGSGQELILMGVNGGRPELDPHAVRARLAVAPAVQADLDRLSLGTLLELVGTFVASADALEPLVQPYPAVTDDNPLMEHGLLSPRSQLKNHGMPLQLVKVATVPAWCPKCFPGGRPIAGLETLGAYTAVMWRDPGVVASDERSRAVVGTNSYLRALFSTAAATSR